MLKRFFISGNYTSPDPPPSARDFYISASGSGNGLTSGTPGPISLLETAISNGSLVGGCNIYFNRGDQFYVGDLTIPVVTGLYFGAFGSGALPRLYGSDVIGSGWTDLGSGLYSKVMSTPPRWVYLNDAASKMATTNWIPSTAIVSSTVIRINAATLSSFPSTIVGAKARVFSYNWWISNELTVTAQDNTTGNITFNTIYNNFGTVSPGVYIVIYNQLQFINENNEWFYDTSNQTLYYKSAVDPGTLNLRAGYKSDGFIVRGQDHEFTNIRMMNYEYALRSQGGISSGVVLDGFIASNCKKFGLLFSAAHNTQIYNSEFRECDDYGFYMTGDNLIAEDSLCDTIGMGFNYGYGNSGFTMVGTNATARRMRTNNIAWCGFVISGANWIADKVVGTQFCKRLRDGGGLYSSGSTANPAVSTNYGGMITNCIFYDIPTTAEGGLSTERAIGIYVDNRCDDMTVEDCTVVGADFSSLANWNTRRTKYRRNVFLGATDVQILFREDTDAADSPLFPNNNGNIVEDNILACRSNTAACVEARQRNGNANYLPFSSGGNSDTNHYVKPYGTTIAKSRATEGGAATSYTLATWRTRNSDDAASTERVNYIGFSSAANALVEVMIEINDTDSPVQFNVPSGYSDYNGNAFSNPVTIPAYSSLPYFKNTAA